MPAKFPRATAPSKGVGESSYTGPTPEIALQILL
jgi:hypothetical protein